MEVTNGRSGGSKFREKTSRGEELNYNYSPIRDIIKRIGENLSL